MRIRDAQYSGPEFGRAWLLFVLAFALHVLDEALTGFLPVYNATVLELYGHFSWFPRMDLEFGRWLTGLALAVAILILLTPLAYRNVSWLRWLASVLVVLMIVNALGHIMATIMGHTVRSVQVARPAPGFYSSPLLLAAAFYLWFKLNRSRPNPADKVAATS